jgi:hypothetical protein
MGYLSTSVRFHRFPDGVAPMKMAVGVGVKLDSTEMSGEGTVMKETKVYGFGFCWSIQSLPINTA